MTFRIEGKFITRELLLELTGLEASGFKEFQEPDGSPTFLWYLDSTLDGSANYIQHADHLVALLQPHADALGALVERGATAEMLNSILTSGDDISLNLGLTKEHLGVFGRIGLQLVLDVICLPGFQG